MKTICSVCGKILRIRVEHPGMISHSYCHDCLRIKHPEHAEEIIRESEKRAKK